jgi:hypothetical protein
MKECPNADSGIFFARSGRPEGARPPSFDNSTSYHHSAVLRPEEDAKKGVILIFRQWRKNQDDPFICARSARIRRAIR